MLVLEKDIETYLKKRVEGLGGRCFKLPAMYETGIPDRLVCLPGGKIFFVELKRPKGGKLSEIQKYQHEKLRALGCRVYVTKNYKEVDEMLKEVNPDIAKNVAENDGYCPCMLEKNEDTKCPCKDIRETEVIGQYCLCGRYMVVGNDEATMICED